MSYRNKITFIIPVFYLSRNRERNFWFVYNAVVKTGCPVIVVEQKLPTSQHMFENKIANSQPNNVRYYNITINDKKIHKSKLINYAVSKSTTTHVWVNDVDSFMYFDEVLRTINFRHKFIKPFDNSINVNQHETHAMVENRPCKLKFDDDQRRHVHVYGALSFIFDKKEFLKLGGMCESYTGWGMEDLDLHMRVLRLYDFHTLSHRAVHLWHPPNKKNNANFEIFRERHPKKNESKIKVKKSSDDLIESIHVFNGKPRVQTLTNQQLGIHINRLSSGMLEHTINTKYRQASNKNIGDIGVEKIKSYTKQATGVKIRKIINNFTSVVNINKNSNNTEIFHVINYLDTDKISANLRSRFTHCVESIDNAQTNNVSLIGCGAAELTLPVGWNYYRVNRDARNVFGDKRDLVFINDMLDIGSSSARDDDFILITNSDCIVTPHIYNQLVERDTYDVVEYHRRDIPMVNHYMQSYIQSFNVKQTGIDGFAIKSRVWKEIKELYPNMVIGEPHWDTVLSGILHKSGKYNVYKNTTDLYHIEHKQTWTTSNLTIAGKNNTSKYNESLKYGMMERSIISLEADSITLIVADRDKKTRDIMNYIHNNATDDILIFEMYETDEQQYNDIPFINYIGIEHDKSTSSADQRNAMMNLLIVQLSSMYEKFNIIFANNHSKNVQTRPSIWFDNNELYDVYESQKMDDFYMREDGLLSSVM